MTGGASMAAAAQGTKSVSNLPPKPSKHEKTQANRERIEALKLRMTSQSVREGSPAADDVVGGGA